VLEATGKLLIEVVSARGISRIIKDGKLMKETKDGDETEWLFDPEERRKFTISCIPFVLEGDTIIKNGSHADVTKDDVEEIWNRCYSAFKSRVKTKNKYHGIWNNCCTSAFESVKQVADESEDFDLKPNLRRINIRDYNLLGVGIPLHDTNDLLIGLCDNPCVAHDKHPDACDIQKGLSRVLSDITLSNILKFVGVYNVRNVQLEEYRDRLISIENCILQYEFSFQCCGRYFGVIRGDAELEAAQALHVAINSTEYGGHQYYGMSKDEILRLIRRTHAKQLFVKADELHRSEEDRESCRLKNRFSQQ
jgi:hypothetical protein